MHLLFVSHSFPPAGRPLANVGGMQRVATELHRALCARSDVTLTDLVLRSSWRWTHVRIVPYMIRVLLALLRTRRRSNYDVILFSSMVTAALAIPFRRQFVRAGVRTAVIAHGRDVTLPVRLYQWLVPYIFGAMDMVLPISDAVRDACLARGASASQLFRVPNGIDTGRFEQFGDVANAKRRLFSLFPAGRVPPEDALILCSVGRQVRRKGFGWFAEKVLPRLPENVFYVLAGDGPERKEILAAAARAGVSSRIILLGRVSEEDLATVYLGSDLFIMPNVPVAGDMEGFGVVMLEAGLNGLPTIAASVDGIRDVIVQDQNGQLLEPLNATAFAEVISAYANDRQMLDVARHRTRAYVRTQFDWTSIAHLYVQTLGILLPPSRSVTIPAVPVLEDAYEHVSIPAAA